MRVLIDRQTALSALWHVHGPLLIFAAVPSLLWVAKPMILAITWAILYVPLVACLLAYAIFKTKRALSRDGAFAKLYAEATPRARGRLIAARLMAFD